MNSGERTGIRTLALFVRDGRYTKQTLTIKDTGSNKYTICVENRPDQTLHYSITKVSKHGQLIGTIEIDRVSEYGLEYNNTLSSLPDSVVKYIREHYLTFYTYLKIGENAFR